MKKYIILLAALAAFSAAFAQLDQPRAKLTAVGEKARTYQFTADTTAAKRLFVDRAYHTNLELPSQLVGLNYYAMPSIKGLYTYRCSEEGVVVALTTIFSRYSNVAEMERLGFARVEGIPEFILFNDKQMNTVAVYWKKMAAGEEVTLPTWSIVLGF